jgi:molybdopterin converting factor small subunit
MAKLVFLGRLRDAAGGREKALALPADGLTLCALIDALDAADPGLGAILRDPSIRVAINQSLAPPDASAQVRDSDEIAFLPPMTGG